MNSQQKAYFAGFIDGEGSVGIQRMKYEGKNPAYAISIRLYSTNSSVLKKLQRWIGGIGSLKVQFRKNKNWKPLWRLHILSNQASKVLEAVLPYLLIKRKHATNALNFQKNRKRGVYLTTQEKQNQKVAYLKSKILNKRGI